MSPQKQHVIHGRDHRPGGADPIPGLSAGGGGIQFDVDNVGGSLLVQTNGANAFGEGLTFNVVDGEELRLYTHGGQIQLQANTGEIRLNSGAGRWSSTGLLLDTTGLLELRSTGGAIYITLASASRLTVQSNAGAKLLEVRNDGTVHIKTGAAWVADL